MWWQLIAGAATIAADILLDNDNDYDYENEQEQKQKARNQLRQERTSINDFANDFDIYANGSDMLSYRQITDVKRKKICRQHQLPIDTNIYYFCEYSEDCTFAISELGISIMYLDNDTNEFNARFESWSYIKNVEYDPEDDVFYIYQDDNEPVPFNRYLIIKNNGAKEEFAEILNRMASLVDNEEENIVNKITELYNNENWSEIINIGEDLIKKELSNRLQYYIYQVLSNSYYNKATEIEDTNNALREECLELALQYTEKLLEYDNDEDVILLRAKIYREMGQPIAARKLFIDLMCSEDKNLARESLEQYNKVTDIFIEILNYFDKEAEKDITDITNDNSYTKEEKEELLEIIKQDADCKFTNVIDIPHRQFIMFVKDCYSIAGCNDIENNIEFVFTLDAYPKDLIFPMGHPQANTLYMVHPMLHTHYLPCENIKETLFLDKIRDFVYLAQCLGATKINFKAIKGEAISIDSENNTDISANVGRKLVNLEGSISNKEQNHYNSTKNIGREWEYTFNPLNKPYCPEDSIWLKSDTSWQQMVKMRLQGNQISFTERISSKETLNISSNQQSAVEASFSTLLWKASGKKEEQTKEIIFKSEENEYEINVTFKPLCEYKEITNVINEPTNEIEISNKEVLTANEEKYKEEVLFYLEDDNQITSDERIMLERKKIKLNISEDRALTIENMCHPTLSDNEKEYIDIYKELCADGEITERKRKMLNREREELGISEERAKELESKL